MSGPSPEDGARPEGLTWDGERWSKQDLAWHNGEWLPKEEAKAAPQGWFRLTGTQRSLRMCLALAAIFFVSGLLFMGRNMFWTGEESSAPNDGWPVAVCFLVSLAFLTVAGLIALGGLLRRK